VNEGLVMDMNEPKRHDCFYPTKSHFTSVKS